MKVSMVYVDAEGSGPEVEQVLRSWMEGRNGRRAQPAPESQIVESPEATPLKAIATGEDPKPRRAANRRTKPAKKESIRSAPGGGETIASRVLVLLKKKPMSSLELSQALSLLPYQVYGPVHTLKKNGVLKSQADDSDGTRRYFLA